MNKSSTLSYQIEELNDLLRDPIIIRMVTIVNLSRLSILELLEYDINRQDISKAFAKDIIAFDTTTTTMSSALTVREIATIIDIGGDDYLGLLNAKVKLTELGIYILETVERSQIPQISKGDPSLFRSAQNIINISDFPNQFSRP